jgi:hypothetical protein
MPVKKVSGGYKWGGRGKVYATRAEEEARRAETLSQKTSKEPTWHTKQAN